MNLFTIFIKAMLIDNIVLMSFLALCPFIGMSTDEEKSIGMGLAVTFVTVLATCVTWPIYKFVLEPLDLVFLKTLGFILVIASLVQLVEFYLKKCVPGLYRSMGIYLALITTNCAILAVTLNNISREYNFVQSLVYAVGVAMGFLLALLLLAGVRARIKTSPLPAFMKGTPVLFVASALLSMAFMGFSGLVK
ncbi:MAG: RnfABCDGE type electron transport complex subunit A [Spirochaetaceae bacterium]|jgi:electron transport complex protein RnfA|nr:RnfABCDGE type electron transport complex subunit A [Spirochaetaceae bacterium]GMO21782.1 MAG: electron transport complex subunit RsxA [Termitinemataceae bacterium]